MSHYCFDGSKHEADCSCDCPSCSSVIDDTKRREFNEKLSKRIKEESMKLWGDKFFIENLIKEFNKAGKKPGA